MNEIRKEDIYEVSVHMWAGNITEEEIKAHRKTGVFKYEVKPRNHKSQTKSYYTNDVLNYGNFLFKDLPKGVQEFLSDSVCVTIDLLWTDNNGNSIKKRTYMNEKDLEVLKRIGVY